MTFKKQFTLGVTLGALCLGAAYGVLEIDQAVLGNPPEPYDAPATLAGLLAFVGLFLIGLSVWRWISRLVFVKTGALQHSFIGDYLRDIPLCQWVLHTDKEGRDRDA